MIAALFVDPRGCYAGVPWVELWGLPDRDARDYAGPWPVVAHPPCAKWCRLAGLVEARWGHRRGDDGGTFASALASVRRWGGVLEHPAWSDAWLAHDLLPPVTGGGWTPADFCGGWTCYVEQNRYGHRAKKATWLYAHNVTLPSLRWRLVPDSVVQPTRRRDSAAMEASLATALISWCGNHISPGENRPRLGKREASATPAEFRDMLLAMAASAALGGEP